MPKKKPESEQVSELVCYDMFLKHTDKDGNSHVQCHRVWDGEKFYASLFEAAKKVGGKSSVEMVTEAYYRSARK